ncbi:MAG: DNA-binding protein [Gemmataceae bacterium]
MPAKGNARAGRPLSKAGLYQELVKKTGLTRKQVRAFFDSLTGLIYQELKTAGKGVFVLPGMLKFQVVHKPAVPGGQRPNPFRPGEMMIVKPKPARKVVRVRPLKKLKELVK